MLKSFPDREVGCWAWDEGVWGDVLENLELPVVPEPLHLDRMSRIPSVEPPLPTQPHVMMAHKPQRRQCSPSSGFRPTFPLGHQPIFIGKPQLESAEEVLAIEEGLHTNSTSHVDKGAGRNWEKRQKYIRKVLGQGEQHRKLVKGEFQDVGTLYNINPQWLLGYADCCLNNWPGG